MIGSYARFQIKLCCTFWTNLTFSRQSCRIINTSCRAQGPSQCGELWHPRKCHNTLSQGGVRSTEVAWCALFPMFAGRCQFCFGAPPWVHKYFRHAKTLFPDLAFSQFKFHVQTHCDSDYPRHQDNEIFLKELKKGAVHLRDNLLDLNPSFRKRSLNVKQRIALQGLRMAVH